MRKAITLALVLIFLMNIYSQTNQLSDKKVNTKATIEKANSGFDTVNYLPAKKAAKRLLQGHISSLDIPGMQIAVSSKGKLIWSDSFGYSDLSNRQPVTNETKFRIGSVSKSLTGAALGRLVQKGLLKFDSRVDEFVPAFPKKSRQITVRQLAGHTSGIRHYNSAEEASGTKHYESVLASLDAFQNDPLLFEPGTNFEYSSYGYVLLSAVLEAVAKEKFPALMEKEVFSPLGMKHTGMDYADKNDSFRSKQYVLDENDKRVEAPFVDQSNKWAAGGMVSTAEDLVKFGEAMLQKEFLKNDIRNEIFTPMKTRDGNETGYGIGWEIRKDSANRKVYVHDGSLPSARAVLALYPEEQLVIAVMANTGKGILFNREEAMMLADLFLNPQGFETSEQERKEVVGEYEYSTFFDQDSITGKINLFVTDGEMQGTITIPNRFFKNRTIPVPVVKVSGKEITLIGLPGNWITLSFKKDDQKINGNWRFGPLKNELNGMKKQ